MSGGASFFSGLYDILNEETPPQSKQSHMKWHSPPKEEFFQSRASIICHTLDVTHPPRRKFSLPRICHSRHKSHENSIFRDHFLSKWHFFQAGSRIYYRLEPEGRKSSALYQNLRSTRFSCFLDILWKTFFHQNIPSQVRQESPDGCTIYRWLN